MFRRRVVAQGEMTSLLARVGKIRSVSGRIDVPPCAEYAGIVCEIFEIGDEIQICAHLQTGPRAFSAQKPLCLRQGTSYIYSTD